mgnify:FL=1
MSNGGDSSSSGNDSVSADVEAGLATESMSDYSVSEGGTGGDNEEYNAVMEQYGPGKNTSPKTSETYDAGGLDPGVPSIYKAGTKPGDYINPNDTGSNMINNARANFASKGTLGRAMSVAGMIINPFSTIGRMSVTAMYQTAKFNKEMGRPVTTGILGSDGSLITKGSDQKSINDVINQSDSNDNVPIGMDARIVNTEGTGLPEPSKHIFNNVGSKNYIKSLYDDVAKSLYTPRTTQGLLATNDSPYYDFLKINKLDRRIL